MITGPSSSPSCAHNPRDISIIPLHIARGHQPGATIFWKMDHLVSILLISRSFTLFTCNLLIIVHVELPPAKRRRTLAGSIVSTALSAALIGTAVGLTVYRLCVLNSIQSLSLFAQLCLSWRDRGKLPDQLPPPPPYQRGDWAPEPVGSSFSSLISSHVV